MTIQPKPPEMPVACKRRLSYAANRRCGARMHPACLWRFSIETGTSQDWPGLLASWAEEHKMPIEPKPPEMSLATEHRLCAKSSRGRRGCRIAKCPRSDALWGRRP